MMKTWAAEVEASAIRVNSVSPGPTRTAMRKKAMPGEDPTTLTKPADLVPLFIELAMPDCTRHGEIVEYQKAKA